MPARDQQRTAANGSHGRGTSEGKGAGKRAAAHGPCPPSPSAASTPPSSRLLARSLRLPLALLPPPACPPADPHQEPKHRPQNTKHLPPRTSKLGGRVWRCDGCNPLSDWAPNALEIATKPGRVTKFSAFRRARRPTANAEIEFRLVSSALFVGGSHSSGLLKRICLWRTPKQASLVDTSGAPGRCVGECVGGGRRLTHNSGGHWLFMETFLGLIVRWCFFGCCCETAGPRAHNSISLPCCVRSFPHHAWERGAQTTLSQKRKIPTLKA